MAGTTGLEPATSAVTGQRSNQLSYVPRRIFCHVERMILRDSLDHFVLIATVLNARLRSERSNGHNPATCLSVSEDLGHEPAVEQTFQQEATVRSATSLQRTSGGQRGTRTPDILLVRQAL